MTLEDLRSVNLNAKRPPADMTDEMWQKYFSAMKLLTTQSQQRKMNTGYYSTINGHRIESQSTYDGDTQWFRYCQFINSILSAIRHGQFDYCFNIYQITELLKYEHDRLRTMWMPDNQCFQVWLEQS